MMWTNPILKTICSGPYGTFGAWCDGDHPLFVTLEPVMPIPAGIHTAQREVSDRFQCDVFRLPPSDFPGHSGIEFHIGNVLKNTDLCILLGLQYGWVLGTYGILYSEAAFNQFMAQLAGVNEFQFTVIR